MVGDEVGDQEHALLGHQLRRGVVDEVAVLDGPHARLGRARDGRRGIGMSADVSPERLRLLDRRHHLAGRELQAIQRVIGRRHAAGHHDLHLVATLAHLLAHRLAHLGVTVGSGHGKSERVAAMAASARIGAAAHVAVAAGGPDRPP